MGENITNVCTSSSFDVFGGIVELRHFAKCKIKIVKQQSVGLGNVVTFFQNLTCCGLLTIVVPKVLN